MKRLKKRSKIVILRLFAFVSIISIALCAFSIGGYALTTPYHFPSSFQTYLNNHLYKLYVSNNSYTNYGYNQSGQTQLNPHDFNAFLILFPKYVYIFNSDGSFHCSDSASAFPNVSNKTRVNFSDIFEVHIVSSNRGTFLSGTDQYYFCVLVNDLVGFSAEELASSEFGYSCLRLKVEHHEVNGVRVLDYYSISENGILPSGGDSNTFSDTAFVSAYGPVHNNIINGLDYFTSPSMSQLYFPVSIEEFGSNYGAEGGITSWVPTRKCCAMMPTGYSEAFFSVAFPSYYMDNFAFSEGSDEIIDDLVDTSSSGCNCDAQFSALRSYLDTNMVTKDEFQALVDMLDDNNSDVGDVLESRWSEQDEQLSSLANQSTVPDSEIASGIDSISSRFDGYFLQIESFQNNLQTVPAEVSQAGAMVTSITQKLPSSIIVAITFMLIVFVVVKVLGR